MPDYTGRITDQEAQAMQAWWTRFVRNYRCPISGDMNWTYGQHLVNPSAYTGAGTTIGGVVYPQLMLICSTCGYTTYISATIAGILPQREGG